MQQNFEIYKVTTDKAQERLVKSTIIVGSECDIQVAMGRNPIKMEVINFVKGH